MEIKINLSTSDLERIKDVLGISNYDDIHTAIVVSWFYLKREIVYNFINEIISMKDKLKKLP